MRLMDALMAFPSIVLAIAVSAMLGASVTNVVIALSIATTPHTARIVRASVLVGRELDYVEAARGFGASDMRILFRHVLINSLGPLIVRLTYVFAIAILPRPRSPSSASGRRRRRRPSAHHRPGPRFHARRRLDHDLPGLAIMVCVLGLNLLGDGLRDVLDPRMEERVAMNRPCSQVEGLNVALGP